MVSVSTYPYQCVICRRMVRVAISYKKKHYCIDCTTPEEVDNGELLEAESYELECT